MTAKHRKILLTLLLIGATSALAGFGTFSAFSSTTANSGNSFAAGTVLIDDNDAGSTMYTVSNQAPGTTVERCIKLTYGGTRAADVRLYTPTASVGGVADYLNLSVEKGTLVGNPAFPGCGAPGDFTAQGAPLFDAELNNNATSHLEFTFGNTAETCIREVSALLAYRSATNAANSGKTSVFDGASESVVYSGDMSSTAITYAGAMVTPAAERWTQGAVNALVTRVGYASDANPDPYWDGAMLELAVP